MKRSELTEFAVEEEGFKLKIRRGSTGLPIVSTGRGSNAPFPALDVTAPALAAAQGTTPSAPNSAGVSADEAGVTYIKSPMVGTFYRAASPESKPFADSGTKVVENTVVCIIEAMKVMNEIKAETRGIITALVAENAKPVEFGQPLFKIRPL